MLCLTPFSYDRKLDAATTATNSKHLIELLKNQQTLSFDLSTI